MKKTNYVYIAYENGSDKFYIGSASCVGNPADHQYYGSGSAISSSEFKPDWKWIYGIYPDRKSAGLAEKELIRQADYKHNPLCMNKRCAGSNHTSESSKKMSEARKGENHYNYGKKLSEETRAKIAKSRKSKSHLMFGGEAKLDARLHKNAQTNLQIRITEDRIEAYEKAVAKHPALPKVLSSKSFDIMLAILLTK